MSVFRAGGSGDRAHLSVKMQDPAPSNLPPRGQNTKDAPQRGGEGPQHRGTGEFVQGSTAIFSYSQNLDSPLLSVSPSPFIRPYLFLPWLLGRTSFPHLFCQFALPFTDFHASVFAVLVYEQL